MSDCDHCYHLNRGPLLMTIPNGHIAVRCCLCQDLKTIHQDHFKTGACKSMKAKHKSVHPWRGGVKMSQVRGKTSAAIRPGKKVWAG